MTPKTTLIDELLLDESFLDWIKNNHEDQKWSQWVNESAENRRVAQQARKIILSMEFREDFLGQDKVDLIKKKIDANILLHRTMPKTTFWSGSMRWAASLLLVATCIAAYFYLKSTEVSEVPQLAQRIEKSTHIGQKLTTNLPDGTKVILNSNSKIVYQLPFNDHERLVELQGEAFFDVAKDTLKPFRVQTHGITTTALGTKFNVRDIVNKQVEVSLQSGKVSVENTQGLKVILLPGKKAIARADEQIQTEAFDYNIEMGWKDGILVFNDATFPEIVEKLENWYGVKISLKTSIRGNIHYSGKYNNESLEEVLQGISFIYHFKFTINKENQQVKIYN